MGKKRGFNKQGLSDSMTLNRPTDEAGKRIQAYTKAKLTIFVGVDDKRECQK